MKGLTVAIIGRPNVGKSTLFNRLTGKKHALVHDLPGVTRDRREGLVRSPWMEFHLIDTAGLEEAEEGSLEARMMMQTDIAVQQAHICLMMIDGRVGVTPLDQFFANWLRKRHDKVITVVNKCEGLHTYDCLSEAMHLGFKNIVMISAEHNQGINDIFEEICQEKQWDKKNCDISTKISHGNQAIQLAIVGRPNSGKSTLINHLIGEERLLTGPEAGVTRDAVRIDWHYQGKDIHLIDTAGIRKKASINNQLERMSVADGLRAVQFAHVVIVLADATLALEKQDLSIANMAVAEGRAIIFVANKWDLVKDKQKVLQNLTYKITTLLPEMKGIPIFTISALYQHNISTVMDHVLIAYDRWNRRVSTAKLNQWLQATKTRHPPPITKGKKRIQLKYITQGNTRPPSFTLFSNQPQAIPKTYKRYLVNALREAFSFHSVPIRLMLRKTANPYTKK